MYVPGWSAMNVGCAILVADRVAVLPVGFRMRDHVKLRGNCCGSAPDPASVTSAPWTTVWFGPALAVGAWIVFVAIETVAAALSTLPSLTTSWAIYVPARSAVKVGFTAEVLLKVAALPWGNAMRLHL